VARMRDINLDSVPPNTNSSTAESSFGLANNVFGDDSTLVSWTGNETGMPTAAKTVGFSKGHSKDLKYGPAAGSGR
jgi:hypothetical protein